MPTLSKLVRWGVAILVTGVVLTASLAVYACNTGHTSYRLYAVRTGSMSPAIPSKSEVIVRKGNYHVGQVISFTYAGETITHRLVKLDHGFATTKGDANPNADPFAVPEQNIIGGVVSAPKEAGWIMLFLTHTWVGKLDLVLLLVIFWMIADFPAKESSVMPRALPLPA